MTIELFHEALTEIEAAVAKARAIGAQLFGDAETDATQVAATAATSGLDAAAKQAEGDATTLVDTAVTDVKGAVSDIASAPTSTTSPAAPTAPAADVTTPPASA